MIRATARCAVFGRAQPVLPATTHRGEPVRLRPLRGEDVPAIVAACTDPDSVRFTTVPHPYSAAQAEDFVHTFAPTAWARGFEAVYAVADGEDRYAGSMTLRLEGDELTTLTGEVGYLIGPWARGRGYASAALSALCDWGFAALRLHRIEWQAYVGNDASRAVAQRAGFQIEGATRDALVQRGCTRPRGSAPGSATDPRPQEA